MQIANKKRTLNAFFFIKTNKIKTNFTLTKRLKPIYKVNNHSMKKIFLPVGSGIGCFDQTKKVYHTANNWNIQKFEIGFNFFSTNLFITIIIDNGNNHFGLMVIIIYPLLLLHYFVLLYCT